MNLVRKICKKQLTNIVKLILLRGSQNFHLAGRNRHFAPLWRGIAKFHILLIFMPLQYANNIKFLNYCACLAVIENCGTNFLLLHEILVARHRFI